MINKVIGSVEEAIADINDGAMIALAGFCTAGVPRFLLRALVEKGTRNLTLACGCGPLLAAPEEKAMLVGNRQLSKVIDSYALHSSANLGSDDPFEQAVRAGDIELELHPMGTLAEKYRAGGAGIPAFYTPTGRGSVVEKNVISNFMENRKEKETMVFDGQNCILERALKPDFAFIRAAVADTLGNLRYRKTGRNFGPVMAAAARITIVEVEEIVAPGEIPADDVHTPGIYVQRLVKLPPLYCAIQ